MAVYKRLRTEQNIGKISPCEPCFVARDRLGNALRLIVEDERKQIIAAMDRNEIKSAYAAAHPSESKRKVAASADQAYCFAR